MTTTLLLGAAWIVLSTLAVICVRDVRDFRLHRVADAEPELAPAAATTA
jgi:hypothetical protein